VTDKKVSIFYFTGNIDTYRQLTNVINNNIYIKNLYLSIIYNQKRVNYKIYYVIGIHYQADANDNFNNVQSRGT
jgi:hypothetical protein